MQAYIRVLPYWEFDLLHSLSEGHRDSIAVPSLSHPQTEAQSCPMENAFPDLWNRDDRETRVAHFNRMSALNRQEVDRAVMPIYLVDTKLIPKRPELDLICVDSTVVYNGPNL